MNRAVGVYAFIAENEVDDPTTTVFGEGPLPQGPQLRSTLRENGLEAEEGLVAMSMPQLGVTQFIFLDVPESRHVDRMMQLLKPKAVRVARLLKKRIELVHFGENGREHIEWIE